MLIVDKRNDGELIGDYSSYLFVKHLDYQPLHIDTIVKNIISEFGDGIDILTVKRDAEHLFERLSEFGFVQKSNVQNVFDDREIEFGTRFVQIWLFDVNRQIIGIRMETVFLIII